MKQGTTTTFKVKQFDLPDITEIIFSFTNDKNNVVVERTTPTTDDGQIHKSYPSEVSLEDGYYKIGLDQDETLKLNETFYVEAQIMFSGAVTKAYIDKVKMPHTFYTKVIDGATTNGEEIELAMELSDVIEINGGSTGDYTDLTNKPRINNIELVGNKTASDLGLDIEAGDGLKRAGNVVSVDLRSNIGNPSGLEFTDGKLGINGTALSNFTNLQQGLGYGNYFRQYLVDTNYSNPLATTEYVDNLISTSLKRLVVEQLPQNPNTYTIYMVLRQAPTTNNIYDEYMYINNAWELIGSTEVDLSNYYTKSESNNRYSLQTNTYTKNEVNNIAIQKAFRNYSDARYNMGQSESGAVALNVADYDTLKITATTMTMSNSYKLDNETKQTFSRADLPLTIDVSSASKFYAWSGFTGEYLTYDLTNTDFDYATQTDLSSKQDTIDSTHKLSADNVDDTNTTNKFVSANEKQTWNGKADNTTISTDTTSTTVSLTLTDNHEYRYTQELTSLTLTMPNGDFISSIVFASGSTPTSMTYDSNIKWSGDDISNGQFVPSADKDYDIMMYYNGLNVNGIVRGV